MFGNQKVNQFIKVFCINIRPIVNMGSSRLKSSISILELNRNLLFTGKTRLENTHYL